MAEIEVKITYRDPMEGVEIEVEKYSSMTDPESAVEDVELLAQRALESMTKALS